MLLVVLGSLNYLSWEFRDKSQSLSTIRSRNTQIRINVHIHASLPPQLRPPPNQMTQEIHRITTKNWVKTLKSLSELFEY